MDEELFFRVSRIGQVCHVGGTNLAKSANKQERERRLANLGARVSMGLCVFDDAVATPEPEELSPRRFTRAH